MSGFLFFKGQEQIMQADLPVVWSVLIVEKSMTIGCQLSWSSILGRGVSWRVPVTWGQAQECIAGTWGPASGHLHGTQVPTASPSLIIRALLIMLCKWGEMDFTFPPARLCTALHLLSPFKNTESSEKGNGSFYLFARRIGTALSSNHPGPWSAKLPFVVRCPHPQIIYKTHTDNCMPHNKLFPDSAKPVRLGDENVTAFADKPSDQPQHLVLIHMSGW